MLSRYTEFDFNKGGRCQGGDYECGVKAAFDRHRVTREFTDMTFFKVRANKR